MNIDVNSLFQLMMASSLMSGKGFDFGNFMGDLNFEKILGLQMISSVNFGNAFNLNGQQAQQNTNVPATVDTSQVEAIKELVNVLKEMKTTNA